MHQWSTLRAREDGFINRCCPRFAGKDHPAARAAKRFMGSSRNEVSVRNRIRMQAGSHKTRDMCHINEEKGTYIISNSSKRFEIDRSRISAGTGYKHARLMLERQFTNFVVINAEIFFTYAVRNEVIENTGSIDRTAMR